MRARVFALALLPLPLAAATDTAASEACAPIADDAARLACYDAAWRTAEQRRPAWVVRPAVSAFDGSAGLVAELPAEAPFTDRFGAVARARLVLACREGTLRVWLHFGGAYVSERAPASLGGDAPAEASRPGVPEVAGPRVRYRLDEEAPRVREFQVANDRRALGFWTDRAARLFLAELQGHRRLTVRATPFRTRTVTASFALDDLPQVLERLRAACARD